MMRIMMMGIMLFVNRQEEMNALQDELNKVGPRLIIIHGRRRTGKTRLAVEAARQHQLHCYFLCEESSIDDNVQRLATRMAETLDDLPPRTSTFAGAFQYLKKRIGKKPYIVIIDEFPYLIKIDPSILSHFQRIYDEILSDTNIKLILVGSSLGMMESHVLSYKSPLYGRRSMQIKLRPLTFKDALLFFPNYSFSDMIIVHSILGGMPAYLIQFDPEKSIEKNIRECFLNPVSFLYAEGEFLLKEEFTVIRTYRRILQALTKTTQLSEMANLVGRPASDLPRYLQKLMELELITKQSPLLGKKRRPHYYINDNYLEFWYRYVYPHRDLIEAGDSESALKKITATLNAHVGKKFEQTGKEFLMLLNKRGELPFAFEKLGRQWGRIQLSGHKSTEYEIDLVAINETEKKALFVECKWKERVPRSTMNDLKTKSTYVGLDNRWTFYHGIIAKSVSFTPQEKEFTWTLTDMERPFRSEANLPVMN